MNFRDLRQMSNYQIHKQFLQFFHHNMTEKQSKVHGPDMVGWGLVLGSRIVGDIPIVAVGDKISFRLEN